MTLEINEIAIHINVGPQPRESSSPTPMAPKPMSPMQNDDEIVQRCVRAVLAHLRMHGKR